MSLVNYSPSSSSPSSEEDVQDINKGTNSRQAPQSEACTRKRVFRVTYDFQEEQKEPLNPPPKRPVVEKGELCSFLPAPKHSTKVSNEVKKDDVSRSTRSLALNPQETTSGPAKEAQEAESVPLFSLRKSQETLFLKRLFTYAC